MVSNCGQNSMFIKTHAFCEIAHIFSIDIPYCWCVLMDVFPSMFFHRCFSSMFFHRCFFHRCFFIDVFSSMFFSSMFFHRCFFIDFFSSMLCFCTSILCRKRLSSPRSMLRCVILLNIHTIGYNFRIA